MGVPVSAGNTRMSSAYGLDRSNAVETCKAIGQRDRLDPDAVGIFIANHSQGGAMCALNFRTGKVEPFRNEKQLERLLLTFCHAYEHQPD